MTNQPPYMVILDKLLSGDYPDNPHAISPAQEEQLYQKWRVFLYHVDIEDTWISFLNRIIKV